MNCCRVFDVVASLGLDKIAAIPSDRSAQSLSAKCQKLISTELACSNLEVVLLQDGIELQLRQGEWEILTCL